MKTGRKDVYPEVAPKIIQLIREGCTFKQAFQTVGVAEGTFYKWKADKAEFSEAIKKAMEERQEEIVNTLEKSLFKRANGYTITESKTEYAIVDKKLVKVKETKTIKEIAPDTGALVFALTNLAPEKWQNKQKQEISADGPAFTINVSNSEEADLIKKMSEK